MSEVGGRTRSAMKLGGFFLLALAFGCARQPEKPLELRLTLAKTKIISGEHPWYLLQVTNVGRKPVLLQGKFWHVQNVLNWGRSGNDGLIKFEIIGPDGSDWPQLTNPFGHHGEFQFWTNDCGGGRSCQGFEARRREGPWPWSKEYVSGPYKRLAPGETWSATPSMVAPIRPRQKDAMDDPGDMRALPEIPKEWSPQKVAAMQKWWKEQVESTGYLMGEPGFRGDPKSRPEGFRVLNLYSFDKPGKYRMRIHYDCGLGVSLTVNSIFPDPPDQEKRLILGGWPKETRVFRYETNWVEFEVVPSSFPTHLFKRRSGLNAEERSKLDVLEQTLKESQIWAEDTPEEKAAKIKKENEAALQRREKDAKIKKLMQDISEREAK